jgi:hypothetical protein
VPSGIGGFEHRPVSGSQAPKSWQRSGCGQTVGFVPVQAPPWQTSVRVHALPSLHAEPSAFCGSEQAPVIGLHAPASWHGPVAEHATGSEPLQMPPWQASLRVQRLPSSHAVPFGFAGFEHVPVEGLQVPAS